MQLKFERFKPSLLDALAAWFMGCEIESRQGVGGSLKMEGLCHPFYPP
jgi:hypothetical protein